MIKIKAERNGKQTAVNIKLRGSGEDLIQEAVAIMMNLPVQINNAGGDLFKAFVETYHEAIEREVRDNDKQKS